MKVKFSNLGLLFIAGVTALTSCNNNLNDYYAITKGVGDIISVGTSEYKILLDDADTVLVTNGISFGYDVGDRVSFAGELMSQRELGENKFYEFRAVAMNSVLTKEVVSQSFINEDFENRTDSIGNDVISITGLSVNKKYMNVTFLIYRGDTDISHFVNMVHDDINTPIEVVDGVLTLDMDLRHNSNNDTARYPSYGLFSIDVKDFVNIEGVEEIVFKVTYPESSTTNTTKSIKLALKEEE